MFPTRDDLLKWVKGIGRKNATVLNIFRSEKVTHRRGTKTKLLIGCEKSGNYRPWKNPKPVRNAGSKKCQCPFRLRGKPESGGDGWTLHVVCGIHNHILSDDLKGHPYLGRLNPDEKTLLQDMTLGLVKPSKILGTIKEHNKESMTSLKQVYNYRQAYRRLRRGDRTEMQHLLSLMERDKYVYRVNKLEDSNIVNDIFWAHPDSIKLANTFHYVLVIDSTYKTCRHGLPLLEIVGLTPTGKTFSAAFVYLHAEKAENFRWALNMLKEQMSGVEVGVIVTDAEKALMNAVREVFPKAINTLCTFHITKHVKARCKRFVFPKEKQESVYKAWEEFMYCHESSLYEERLNTFKKLASGCSMFYNYVQDTWLDPHKEKFVTVYTDRYMHLGETTTNR